MNISHFRLMLVVGTALGAANMVVVSATAQELQHVYHIDAQPLGASLKQFAATSGAEILFSESDVAQKQAPAVNGRYDRDAALTHILSTSGLTYKAAGPNTVVVSATQAQNPGANSVKEPPSSPPVSAPTEGGNSTHGANTGSSASYAARADIEEVTVTAARRHEEDIQKVPVAVTALSGEKLDRLQFHNSDDLNKISGLANAACNYGRNCFEPSLRGQGTKFTGQASVIGYFAEVPGFEPSYYDLDSLQVVKGPQGTLFGETATAGVILFGPKKPTNAFGGYVDVQGGGANYAQIEGAVGGAIVEDKLMVRAAGQFRRRDGYTTAISSYGAPPTKFDNIDRSQWRFSVIWKPTESIENYTIYAGSHDRSNGFNTPLLYVDSRFMNPAAANFAPATFPFTAIPFQFYTGYAPPAGQTYAQLADAELVRQTAAGGRVNYYNFNRHTKSDFTGIINQTRWEITDKVAIKNIYGLFWTKAAGTGGDIDSTDLPLLDVKGRYAPGTTNVNSTPFQATGGWPARSWRDEVQIQGKSFDDKLDWQAGFYYREIASRAWTPNQGFLVAFGTPVADPASPALCASLNAASPCSTLQRTESTSYAAYGQVTYALTNAIHLTGGYRHTWDNSHTDTTATSTYFATFQGIRIPFSVTGRSPLPGATISTTATPPGQADTYTLTADWQVNSDTLFYLAHRTGYKGGGINGVAPVNDPRRVYGPERVKDVEIGAKADWDVGGVRARTNLALYYDWYTNIQQNVPLPNGGGNTVTTNNADATIKGIEFDGTIYPTSWFQLAGNFAFTDPKFTKYPEDTTCALTYYYSQCATLPGTAPVHIDHAHGVLTINGVTTNFKPDRYGDTSKIMWSIQPTFLFKEWLHDEDVSLTANIYYKSSFIGSNIGSNYSLLAQITPHTVQSFLGPVTDPFLHPAYTLTDLRIDWRHIFGSRASLAASVTNVFDKTYIISGTESFSLTGTVQAQLGDPRMWFLEMKYEF